MAFELDTPAALKLGRSSLMKPPRHTPTFSELPLSSARAEMSGIGATSPFSIHDGCSEGRLTTGSVNGSRAVARF